MQEREFPPTLSFQAETVEAARYERQLADHERNPNRPPRPWSTMRPPKERAPRLLPAPEPLDAGSSRQPAARPAHRARPVQVDVRRHAVDARERSLAHRSGGIAA